MQKITPFLGFDNNAEEAMNFYTSVFKSSRIGRITRWGKDAPGPEGTVMTATFQLHGQDFIVLNGGPHFKFNEAVSFLISCETQEEVDELWEKLSENGKEERCGWLKDKFGLSWQVVPLKLNEMLNDPDPAKAKRVMMAMMQMNKIDLRVLEEAYHSQ